MNTLQSIRKIGIHITNQTQLEFELSHHAVTIGQDVDVSDDAASLPIGETVSFFHSDRKITQNLEGKLQLISDDRYRIVVFWDWSAQSLLRGGTQNWSSVAIKQHIDFSPEMQALHITLLDSIG